MRAPSSCARLLVSVLGLSIATTAQQSVHIHDARLVIVRNVLNQAAQKAGAIPDAELREDILSAVAVDLAGLGDLEGALSAVELIRPENRRDALIYVTRQLARRGEVDKAFFVLDRIEDPDVRLEAALNFASARAWEGDISTALQVAHSVSPASPGGNARVLAEIGLVQARSGDLTGAAVTFDQAEEAAAKEPDERKRMRMLGQIAVTRSAGRDRPGAATTARRMETEADRPAGSSAHDVALAEVANARARAGEPVEPGDVAGIEDPEERAFALRRVAGAQAFAGRMAEAFATIAAIESSEERDGALSDVADSQARVQKNFEAALETAGRIELPTIRAQRLASIATLQSRAGDLAGATQTTRRAHDALHEVAAEGDERDRSIAQVAGAVAELEGRHAALELAVSISDPRHQANAYLEIALAENFVHGATEVPAWINELDSPYIQAHALRGFALGLMLRVKADARRQKP